jgi:hypothetical protein
MAGNPAEFDPDHRMIRTRATGHGAQSRRTGAIRR